MKLTVALFILAGMLAFDAFGAGSEAIIKQRAKDLSNQNNVRQGIAPAAPTPPPAGTTATRPVQTPQQKLLADLSAIKPNAAVSTEHKQQIARDLLAAAQGLPKPSLATANKLAEELSAALGQKSLSDGTRTRLVQDLNAALNPTTIPATQMQDIISDIQAIFQANGSSRKEAVAIADQVKGMSGEISKPAGK